MASADVPISQLRQPLSRTPASVTQQSCDTYTNAVPSGKQSGFKVAIAAVTSMNVAAGPAGTGLTPTYSNVPQYGFAFSKVRSSRLRMFKCLQLIVQAPKTTGPRHRPDDSVQQHTRLLAPIRRQVLNLTRLRSRSFDKSIRPPQFFVSSRVCSIASVLCASERAFRAKTLASWQLHLLCYLDAMLRRRTIIYCFDHLQTSSWLECGGAEHCCCRTVCRCV